MSILLNPSVRAPLLLVTAQFGQIMVYYDVYLVNGQKMSEISNK